MISSKASKNKKAENERRNEKEREAHEVTVWNFKTKASFRTRRIFDLRETLPYTYIVSRVPVRLAGERRGWMARRTFAQIRSLRQTRDLRSKSLQACKRDPCETKGSPKRPLVLLPACLPSSLFTVEQPLQSCTKLNSQRLYSSPGRAVCSLAGPSQNRSYCTPRERDRSPPLVPYRSPMLLRPLYIEAGSRVSSSFELGRPFVESCRLPQSRITGGRRRPRRWFIREICLGDVTFQRRLIRGSVRALPRRLARSNSV